MFMVSLFQIEDYINTEERKTLCLLAHLLPSSEVADRKGIPLQMGGQKCFESVLNGIYMYLPMQLTDWLLVEMKLLLIGTTQNSLTKTGFNHHAVIDSHIGLTAQAHLQRRSKLLAINFC